MSVSDLMPEHPPGSIRTGNIAEEVVHGQVDLQVTVVSPAKELFSGKAHWVTLPGLDGQFGIWPRHVAMVSALGSGVLRVGLRDHSRVEFVVRGSFLSVADNVVTILVDLAVTKDDVDEAVARRELDETNAALQHPTDEAEFARLLEFRDWCQARLKLAAA
jgi:F-type H+-transporting ATPase subunit epsilon